MIRKYFLYTLLIGTAAVYTSCENGSNKNGNGTDNDSLSLNEGEPITFLTDSDGSIIKPGRGELILQFNPPKDKKYDVSMRTTTKIKQSGFGQVMESYMDVTTSNTITIKSNNEDSVVLSSMVTAFKTTMKQDTMEAQFENGKTANDEQADFIRKILDCYIRMPLDITMDKSAEVKNVRGIDAVQEKIATTLGQDAVMASLQLSDLNQEVVNSFVAFPNKPVGKGDTWTSTDSVDLGGFPVIVNNTYTLTDFDDDFAQVEVSSQYRINKEMIKQFGGTGDEVKLSGSQKGNMKVARNSGWSVQSALEQTFSISMDAEGQPVSVQISGKSTLNTK